MKPLSQFILAKGFKMATLKMVAQSLHQGDFLASLDLSDAYFHVAVAKDQQFPALQVQK